MGFEQARRCRESGRFPALSRIAEEGFLGPSRPASPVCQTPPALIALFCGAEPQESHVWGFTMPDPKRPERSMSGFHAQLDAVHPIWEQVRESGIGSSIMNVGFRNDTVWRTDHIDFAYDGYRLWRRPGIFRLGGGPETIVFQGIELRVSPFRNGLSIRKGSREIARLAVGEGRHVGLGGRLAAVAHLIDPELLLLSPLIPAAFRGAAVGGPGLGILH